MLIMRFLKALGLYASNRVDDMRSQLKFKEGKLWLLIALGYLMTRQTVTQRAKMN